MTRRLVNARALLHMGGTPQARAEHSGVNRCCRMRFSPPQSLGSRWAAQVSANNPLVVPRLEYRDICGGFGVTLSGDEDAYEALVRTLATPPAELQRLPPIAAIAAGGAGDEIPGFTDSLAVVLAVLARCAGRIFMRDQPPTVLFERLCRPVVLLIPETWSLAP